LNWIEEVVEFNPIDLCVNLGDTFNDNSVLISGFSEEYSETVLDTYRVINKNVCNG
jgi:hypothetical protein